MQTLGFGAGLCAFSRARSGALAIVFFAAVVPANAEVIYSSALNGTALAQIDTTTGAGTVVGNFGYRDAFGGAFSSSGTFYTVVDSYSASGRLATVNLATGAATPLGAAVGVADLMVLEFATDDTMYAGSWATNSLYTVNTTTGTPTLVGALGFGNVMDFAFDSNGTLWATNSASLYTVNTSTGAGTFVTNLSGTDGCVMGITFDSADQLFATSYCAQNSPLWQINTTTGVATAVGLTGQSSFHGGDVLVSAVPEPGLAGLVGAGLFAAMRRRRARSSQ